MKVFNIIVVTLVRNPNPGHHSFKITLIGNTSDRRLKHAEENNTKKYNAEHYR
jgi:hypothetical protein